MSRIRELADALHALTLVTDGVGFPPSPEDVDAAEDRALAAFDAVLDERSSR